MRKIYFFLLVLLSASSLRSQLLTEPFSYTPHATNGLATQSSAAWVSFNSGDEILVQSGSLSYTGLSASSGNSVIYGGAGIDYYRTFTSQTTGTVYYSFLLNISSLGTINTTGGYTVGFIDGGTSNFSARLWLRLNGAANFNIGINPGSATANTQWAPGIFSPGVTYLVVVSYQFVAGANNDVAKVWINPAVGGAETTADATATNATATDATSIQRFFMRQDGTTATPASLVVDEIRVGTTWAFVTPADVVCSGAPTGQAGFGTITPADVSASINVTAGTGGTGRVLKINTTNSFVDMIDGADPSANTAYGGGEQVIYNSIGTGPVNVTGLTASTTYYLGVYEYNCTVGRFYLNPAATTSFSTTAPVPNGLQLLVVNTPYTIDFDNTVSGVNNGQFNITSTTWGTATPAVGQVNSNSFAFSATSSTAVSTFGGSLGNGNTATTPGQTTFGVYAFEVSTGNRALGMQPTGSGWFNGGNFTLRVQNQTGATLTSLLLTYKIYTYNNEARSTTIGFASSADNGVGTYNSLVAYDFSTPLIADGTPAWKTSVRQVLLTGLNVVNLDYYYLRVNGTDNGGSGSRDEFAFDDITVVANPSGYTPSYSGNIYDAVLSGASSLSGATTIETNLTLLSGNMTLGANPLTVGGTVTGSSTAYVRTNGITSLLQLNSIGAVPKTFPVGNSTYNPITIVDGSGFNWTVRVEDALNNVAPPFNTDKAINRTWHISPSSTVVTGPDVTFGFDDSDPNQLANPGAYNDAIRDAQFWHYTGTNWIAASGAVPMTPAPGVQSITLNDYLYYSPFAIAKINGPLPVKFTDIRAYQQGSGIRVDWSNLTESDVVNYKVERSVNGIDFAALGTVAAAKNDGGRANYSFFDAFPAEGINYYRIQSLEVDGRKLNSMIVRVNTRGGVPEITVFPNPVTNGQLSFQAQELIKGDYTLRIFNTGGQQVFTKSVMHTGGALSEVVQLPGSMKPGVYNLIISSGEMKLTKSFIIR